MFRLAETKKLKDILEVINEMHPTDEFNGEMFRRLIDNVKANERADKTALSLKFYLKYLTRA